MCAGKLMRKFAKKLLSMNEETVERSHCVTCEAAGVRRHTNSVRTCHRWSSCDRGRDDYCSGPCQNTSPLSDLVFVPMNEGGIPAGWHSSACLRLRQELSDIAPETSSSGEEYKVCEDCICSSSQQPVPVCVCEDCYLHYSCPFFLSGSPHQTSSRCATSGGTDSSCTCSVNKNSYISRHKVGTNSHADRRTWDTITNSRTASNKKKRDYSGVLQDQRVPDSPKYDSHLQDRERQAAIGRSTPLDPFNPKEANLPPSICISFDGEEGYIESQRSLFFVRQLCQIYRAEEMSAVFHPPPNKTICHISR